MLASGAAWAVLAPAHKRMAAFTLAPLALIAALMLVVLKGMATEQNLESAATLGRDEGKLTTLNGRIPLWGYLLQPIGDSPLLMKPGAKPVKEKPLREFAGRKPHKDRGEPRPRKPRSRSDAPPMERFRIEVGHDHGVKPGNIVGAIANEAGLDAQNIGRVEIEGAFSTVELPVGMPKEIFKDLKKVWVCGQTLNISRLDQSGPKTPGRSKPVLSKGVSSKGVSRKKSESKLAGKKKAGKSVSKKPSKNEA